MNANRDILLQQYVLTDYIELNRLMPDESELTVINETSDVFILFGLATLYACACPIVPIIVIIHHIIDVNLSLYASNTSIRRPAATLATSIGPWLSIAEFMGVASVICNCLLLYFSTPVFTAWLKYRFNDLVDDKVIIWILVAIEHAIILLKSFGQVVIPDVPNWVIKS